MWMKLQKIIFNDDFGTLIYKISIFSVQFIWYFCSEKFNQKEHHKITLKKYEHFQVNSFSLYYSWVIEYTSWYNYFRSFKIYNMRNSETILFQIFREFSKEIKLRPLILLNIFWWDDFFLFSIILDATTIFSFWQLLKFQQFFLFNVFWCLILFFLFNSF
jgi:hypothetical protein